MSKLMYFKHICVLFKICILKRILSMPIWCEFCNFFFSRRKKLLHIALSGCHFSPKTIRGKQAIIKKCKDFHLTSSRLFIPWLLLHKRIKCNVYYVSNPSILASYIHRAFIPLQHTTKLFITIRTGSCEKWNGAILKTKTEFCPPFYQNYHFLITCHTMSPLDTGKHLARVLWTTC